MKPKHQWMFFIGLILATSGMSVKYIFTGTPDWVNLPVQVIGLIFMLIYIFINREMFKHKNSD